MFEDCRAFWKFDEASGMRYDSRGPFDLYDSGSNGSVAGVIDDALDMPADPLAYLSSGSVTSNYPRLCQDFTLTGWYRQDAARDMGLIFHCVVTGGGETTVIRLLVDDTNQFVFDVNGDSSSVATADTFGVIPDATWLFFACRWNATTGTARISIDDGANDSGSAGGPGDDSAATTVSLSFSNSALWDTSTINVDDAALFSRELSDAEVTALYESAGGLAPLLPVAVTGPIYYRAALSRPLQHV